jgi:hypothetical protein
MEDTPATRQATKSRIGPWYVLQTRNPSAPGMKYATLLALINRAQVTPRSIVRGPTTHQLWRQAAHVRGVSREFGLCYSCGGDIERTNSVCEHCQRSQDPPVDPDVLLEPRASTNGNGNGTEPYGELTTHASRLHELRRQRLHVSVGNKPKMDLALRSDGRVVSAMNLAAALNVGSDDSLPSSRRRWLKVAGLLLALVLLAGAGLLWLRPEYQEPTFSWLRQTWGMIQTKVSSIDWPSGQPAAANVPPMVDTSSEVPRHTPPTSLPVFVAPEPDPAPPPAPQPAPPPEPVDPTPPLEKARKLRSQAIDAEAIHDHATAVKLYQQIKQLPSDVWPTDLQLRLDLAEKSLRHSPQP